ncbi:unannotated protein [freshwater metagenome]|uniref:Unannotated protein n=1 Tax=freshwater metagenome TaxID=449393 RepID=A0A6J6W3E6_9ZZZZ
MRTVSSANQRKNSAAYAASPRASGIAFPFSREINVAIASNSLVIISKALRKISDLNRGAVFAHAIAAASAAAIAASHCASEASETSAITELSLGSWTATLPAPSTHWPSIYNCVCIAASIRSACKKLKPMRSTIETLKYVAFNANKKEF